MPTDPPTRPHPVGPPPSPPDPGLDGRSADGRSADVDDPDLALLLDQVPEFVPVYLDLVHEGDGPPGGPAVFTELADFTADLLIDAGDADRRVVDRVLAAVEAVAEASPDAVELVVFAFLDNLTPAEVDRVVPAMGPVTLGLCREYRPDDLFDG